MCALQVGGDPGGFVAEGRQANEQRRRPFATDGNRLHRWHVIFVGIVLRQKVGCKSRCDAEYFAGIAVIYFEYRRAALRLDTEVKYFYCECKVLVEMRMV